MDKKQLIGGTLALILLGFYAYLVVYAVLCALGVGNLTSDSFTPGMSSGLATISGLVAALVIAELAVTPPGNVPVGRTFTAAPVQGQPAPAPGPAAKRITMVYLLIWLATGITAYVVGDWLRDASQPDSDGVQALTDLGKAWLGIAVAAGYSYLGIHQ